MSSETCFLLVNMSCETRLHSADVNEANGDGSWERIYDGLVLSFLQIHPCDIERLPTFQRQLRYESTLQTHFHCHRSSCISDVWAQEFTPWKNEQLEPKTGGLEGDFPFSMR